MGRPFAEVAFTESVKEAQAAYGSRAAYQRMEAGPSEQAIFEEREIEFISARDSMYMSTVSETDWPYVQHRGGPVGFLRVLDEKTLGFADFSGNQQFLSVGNLKKNNKICLFLMDYTNKRRLKIWGYARMVSAAENPELMTRLEMSSYRARIERAFIIELKAYDWNCPQHITPRFSEAQINQKIAALLEENKSLRAKLQSL